MTKSLRLTRAHFPVTALGYGRRLGLWVQGCRLACPGCIAKDTWDPEGGVEVGLDELLSDISQAVAAGADGLTISGGEPLQQVAGLTALLREVRALPTPRPFDIMLYTGYEYGELDSEQASAAALPDVLITGRYLVTAPTRRIWRGSANQEMHLLTPLARQRYQSYLDYEPDAPPIQLEADTDGHAWWVGVPNHPETKRQLDKALAALGYLPRSVSWRRRLD